MRRLLIFLPIFVIFQTSAVFGATPNEPAFRQAAASVGYPWNNGFTIRFDADEAQCKVRYGARWREKCAAALGRYGDTVKGVKMSPAASGHWQWNDGASMAFIPETGESIKPNTEYAIDISGVYRPSSVIVDKDKLRLHTPPLSVNLKELRFWTDPSPAGRHRLAGSFEFNYPVPESAERIELNSPAGSAFGKPEVVWNRNRDKLNVSWQVNRLPESEAQAKVIFKGMGQVALDDGQPRYWAAGKGEGAVFRSIIPGEDDLFAIKKMEIKSHVDENLDRGYALEVETSLYAKPEDVLKNLRIWELPEFNSPEATEPYQWSNAPALSVAVLKKSRPIQLEKLENVNIARSKFLFRAPVTSGRYIMARMGADLLSASGQKLRRPVSIILHAAPSSPNVAFLQPGNILPLSGKGTLDFYATELDRIEWEVQLVREPFLALIAESSNEPFKQPLSGLNMDMDAFTVSIKGSLPLPEPGGEGKARFASLDLAPVIESLSEKDRAGVSASGLARVNLTGLRNGEPKAWATRMILPTDLGLLVKRGAMGGLDCFVHSLTEKKPVEGAKIFILGANGKPVVERETDNFGHAVTPSLSGLKRESRPVAAVARHDGRLAWLPLEDRSRELNYSEFPTGGAHSTPDGMNTYVFSQRGLYRPGDTLHFGCVSRRADFSLLPEEMPLYAELRDPRGAKIHEKIFKSGEFGIAEISWPLPEDARSGRYTFNILTGKDGENIGSLAVRVEEFQPDTLKLKIDAPEAKGWIQADKPARVGFALQNLYGTPAASHLVKATARTSPANFHFPQYSEYVFTDSSPFRGEGQKRSLPQAKTDANGKTSVDLPGDLLGAASARVFIGAEGFDLSGGRATIAEASFLVSPMRRILGYKPLDGLTNMRFIPAGRKASLEFIALDPNLEKTAWEKINFTIANRVYVTNLVSDGNGGYRYDETPADLPVKTWTADLAAKGIAVKLDTATPGEFLLTAKDADGAIIAQIPYAVAGERLDPPDAPLAGGKMRVRLDKNEYSSGEEINLSIATPYEGTGLISIERDGVAAFEWFEAKPGESARKIRIPSDFEGKGYVVVSFSRSPQSGAIYMSPHSFAVAPFSANITKRDMGLSLDAPSRTLPGQEMKISVSAREKGQAVVFVVDEGILQLTNYQNPRPLNALLADRALDVRTLQAFDLLMPSHAILSGRISAFGGGMDGGAFGKRFQNPFRRKNEPPITSWSTLLEVGPEPAEISIPIPDYYNGALRVMAVGAANLSAGGAASQTAVVAPLVVTPALPLNVSPGDIFEGGIILANTTDKDAEIKVDLEQGPYFELMEKPEKLVKLKGGEEIVLPFRAKTGNEPGSATIVINSSAEGKNYRRESYLSVRPASPLRASLMGGIADKSMRIDTQRDVYPQNASSFATLSTIPLPLMAGFAQYLNTYPYGCSEQLISRAFAQTLLRAWPIYAGDNKARQKLLDATLSALRARFNGNGISLWPNGEANMLLTAYAGDFLLSLREAGIGAGNDLLDQLEYALEEGCVLNDSTLSAARTCAYSIWVLTRQGKITTQLIENLLQALAERNVANWRSDLTGALIAASQREMHIRHTEPFKIINYSGDGWFDEFAQYALHMTILARYFPEKCDAARRSAFFEAAGMAMFANQYATFSANQGIRALLSLGADMAPEMMEATLKCAENEAGEQIFLLANGALQNYKAKQCREYNLKMPPNSRPLFWQISTEGNDRSPVAAKAAHGIEIERKYLDQNGQAVKKAAQGDVLTVEITARAMVENLPDCVITDILPGGFEMVIKREDGENAPPQGIKYLDRREDRMLVFADLGSQPTRFAYQIRAVNPGVFAVAPIAAEGMYNRTVFGNGESGSMEVVKAN